MALNEVTAVEPAVRDTASGEEYPYERRVIFFTSLGHGMMHFFELIYAGIFTLLIGYFHLSLAQAGLLVAPYLLFLGLGSLPGGLLADRWDSYKVFLLFFFGTSAASFLAGLSRSVWTLGLAFGLLGLFGSLYHPTGLALISLGVRRKGLVMGLQGVFGSLGLAVSPFAAGLLGERFGWPWAFYVPAALGLLCGLVLLFFPIRISHRHLPGPAPQEKSASSGLNLGILLWLYAVMLTTGFAYRGLMTYLPKYLGEVVQAGSLSLVVAGGLFTSLALVAGGVGQMWGGRLTDRVSPFKIYVRLVPFWMPLLVLALLFKGHWLILLLAVFFFFFFSGQPIENQMLARATPARLRSTGYGLKFALNLGIGAVAAPLCGWIGETYGMVWIFYSLAAVLLIATLLVLKLRGAATG